MSGRLEKDIRLENKINSIISNQPKVIKEYAMSFGNKTTNTKYVYVFHVINFCSFLNKKFDIDVSNIDNIKNLNYSHIVAYSSYIKTHSPNGKYVNKEDGSCAGELYAIKHFCKYLKLCRYILYNPCEDMEIPKDRKLHEIVSLSHEEIQIIKHNICSGVGTKRARLKQEKWKNRDFCIVFMAITTGLRISAIVNIDLKDINFNKKTITTIEKGGIERIVFLSDRMMEMLDLWLKDREKLLEEYQFSCDALFISSGRQRIGVNTVRDMLKKYTYNINKNITPHKLRSTAGVNLYEQTGDIYLVAEVLGHKNIQNTKRYVGVSNTRKEYAARVLSDLI